MSVGSYLFFCGFAVGVFWCFCESLARVLMGNCYAILFVKLRLLDYLSRLRLGYDGANTEQWLCYGLCVVKKACVYAGCGGVGGGRRNTDVGVGLCVESRSLKGIIIEKNL